MSTTDRDTPPALPKLPKEVERIGVGIATKLGVWFTAITGVGIALNETVAVLTEHADVIGVPSSYLLAAGTVTAAITQLGRYGQAIAAKIATVLRG